MIFDADADYLYELRDCETDELIELVAMSDVSDWDLFVELADAQGFYLESADAGEIQVPIEGVV